MGIRLPRIPEVRAGVSLADYCRELTRYLKDFTASAQSADRDKERRLEALEKRLDALEAKGE